MLPSSENVWNCRVGRGLDGAGGFRWGLREEQDVLSDLEQTLIWFSGGPGHLEGNTALETYFLDSVISFSFTVDFLSKRRGKY